MKLSQIFFSLLVSIFVSTVTQAAIPRLSQVTLNIYQGGHPTAKDLINLKNQKNVKTDIDLENRTAMVNQETRDADKAGLKFISSPMDENVRPSDRQVNEILAEMQDSNNFPIFIHCFHGQDRSGLIIGLYRVEIQGWAPAKAYQEMLKTGFHTKYKAMDKYFRDRTGYSGK